MAKKFCAYNVLSETKRCAKCGKPLKKRIEVEHPRFTLCYTCFRRKEGRNEKIQS
jgi:formylmethanofuran dehydrogenase subunit E